MRQSGVKGNFYAPFVGEGKRATAFSYPTNLPKCILRNIKNINTVVLISGAILIATV
jgi:hypothetical protein